MTKRLNKGDQVRWAWGEGYGRGEIAQIFTEAVTRTIKGTDVTRNASGDEPAYLIEQPGGDQVLKSSSEVECDSQQG